MSKRTATKLARTYFTEGKKVFQRTQILPPVQRRVTSCPKCGKECLVSEGQIFTGCKQCKKDIKYKVRKYDKRQAKLQTKA